MGELGDIGYKTLNLLTPADVSGGIHPSVKQYQNELDLSDLKRVQMQLGNRRWFA